MWGSLCSLLSKSLQSCKYWWGGLTPGFEKGGKNSSTSVLYIGGGQASDWRCQGRREQDELGPAEMKLYPGPACHIPPLSEDGKWRQRVLQGFKLQEKLHDEKRLESGKRRVGRPRSEPWGTPAEVVSSKSSSSLQSTYLPSTIFRKGEKKQMKQKKNRRWWRFPPALLNGDFSFTFNYWLISILQGFIPQSRQMSWIKRTCYTTDTWKIKEEILWDNYKWSNEKI